MKKINLYNPWYKNANFFFSESKKEKRFLFYKVKEYLEKNLIISISGLRRLGKTTIIKQLISDLLKGGISAKKIFFYNFSSIDNNLEEKLNYYFNNILDNNLYVIECFIFLDELQYSKNWQEIIKSYYDLNNKIHFIVSGSSSLYLHKTTKESLAGRIIDLKIYPLLFGENLYLKYGLKKLEVDFFENNFFKKLKNKEKEILLYKDEFSKFLISGEFPEIINESDNIFIYEYLSNSVIQKIFSKDIEIFNIEKQQEFLVLFKILAQGCAQMVNKTNISQELQINFKTLTSYFNVQEKAFLIYLIPNFLRSIRSQEKSFKKVFISSINLLLNILDVDNFDKILFKDFKGHIIENYVFNAIKQKYEKNLYFYYKNQKEVDIIINKGEEVIPIEIKISKKYTNKDLKQVINFCRNKGFKFGIFVYGGKLKKERIEEVDIYFIPYFLF